MRRIFLGLAAAILLALTATTNLSLGHAAPEDTMSDDTLRIVNQPGNILRTVQNMIDQDGAGQLFRATVVETTDNTVRIQRTGHEPDVAQYAVLDNFPYPRVGDEVLMARVGSGWIVVGSVLRSGLAENYLKIETKLTIEAGGSIEDADGSIWDQSGITLQTLGSQTDAIILKRVGFVDEQIAITGAISAGSAGGQFVASAPGVDRMTAGLRISAKGAALGNLDGAMFEMFLLDRAPDVHGFRAQLRAEGSDADASFILWNFSSSGPPFDRGVNFRMNTTLIGDVGGGRGVLAIANATTNPTSNPTNGGILYVDSGALKYRGTSGTVTTIAVP